MMPPAETARRVAMLVVRGRCAIVNDEKKMQQMQVQLLADETKDNVERFQPYGLSAHPLAGSEVVVAFLGGGRDHGIVLACDDRRYRPPALEPGDVALYTDEGMALHITRDRTVKLTCKTLTIECETLDLKATTSIKVTSPSIDVNES
jgi:phage baseplate assembly protein V